MFLGKEKNSEVKNGAYFYPSIDKIINCILEILKTFRVLHCKNSLFKRQNYSLISFIIDCKSINPFMSILKSRKHSVSPA